jgi:hypothetical protein
MPATVESVEVEERRVTLGLKDGDTIAAAALLIASAQRQTSSPRKLGARSSNGSSPDTDSPAPLLPIRL